MIPQSKMEILFPEGPWMLDEQKEHMSVILATVFVNPLQVVRHLL